MSKQFWGRHLWGRGYFVATSGNITDEVILGYIKNQDNTEKDEDLLLAEVWYFSQLQLKANPSAFSRR